MCGKIYQITEGRGNNLGAAKEVQEMVESFELFFNLEFVQQIAKETNHCAVQFQKSAGTFVRMEP